MQDFNAQIAALRPMLVRIARQRLRNPAWAEDAVSETVIAALERPAAFEGRAQARTWLVGILKHKVVDQIRRHTRECALEAFDDDGPDFDELPAAADAHGAAVWGDPQTTLARRQFVGQLNAALAALPPRHGQAFVMREWLEEDTDAVCRELGVSANHLGVILHRARQKLRQALAPQWTGAAALSA